MTRNQIEFLKLQETARANQAAETEAHRANLERERQGQVSLDLTAKRDANTLMLGQQQLTESIRHSTAMETEQRRSNIANELIKQQSLAETERANKAHEQFQYQQLSETQRANREREQLAVEQLEEQKRAALELEEFRRHQLTETRRANKAQEALTQSRIQYSYDALAETQRANVAAEQQRQAQLAETIRYNQQAEAQRQREIEERIRANQASEKLEAARQVIQAAAQAEQLRSDLSRESETARHNAAWEAIMAAKDLSTSIDLTTGNVSVPVTQSTAVPSGGGSSNRTDIGTSNANSSPGASVVSREITPFDQPGIAGIADSATGYKSQLVKENWSNGQSMFYERKVRSSDGQITSSKKISEHEYKAKLAQITGKSQGFGGSFGSRSNR